MSRINLGDEVRDSISGWEGIAAGRYEYLNGCIRWEIAGADKDGKPESFVFDEPQVQLLVKHTFPSEPDESPRRSVGGPRDNRPVDR